MFIRLHALSRLNGKLTVAFGLVTLLLSCKQFQKVTDLVTNPTARDLYAREFERDTLKLARWQQSFEAAADDSLSIEVPYIETGRFYKNRFLTYSYTLELLEGRVLEVDVKTDTIHQRAFVDLFKIRSDATGGQERIVSNEPSKNKINYWVAQSGKYKLIVQPEIGLETEFVIRVLDRPAFDFPVAGKDDVAIQSFWGASRDGGRRSHQGLDIFASRGTPVVAVTEGKTRFTGNRGLGGKQVWVKTNDHGYSLYYAHLDRILVESGRSVAVGDTLGLVGNTGNARTTAPHLHFGIYRNYRGAIDPLPFIQNKQIPAEATENVAPEIIVTASKANLRNQASLKGRKIGEVVRNDTLSLLGFSRKWAPIKRNSGEKAYVHKNLIALP